ncbi:MAG: MBL fold metallo-hydrolase RNA specificity domain-containing protein [Candidatus Dechloromonas phosphoritropha]
MSAHANQGALLAWLRGFHKPPRQTFVVHGEAAASANCAAAIRDQLGWSDVQPPHPGEHVTI